MKFINWQVKLDRFLAGRRMMPFVWGTQDCAMFAADAVIAMTGTDHAANFRGRYNSAESAASQIEGAGFSDLGELTADLLKDLQEVTWHFAQRGDVALLNQPDLGPTLGIVALDGISIWVADRRGLTRLPLEVATRIWRVT